MASATPAFAAATCNVGFDRPTIQGCLEIIDAGGVIVLPDGSTTYEPSQSIAIDVTIRSATAGTKATISHSLLTPLPIDPFVDGFSFPAGSMFRVENKSKVTFEDIIFVPHHIEDRGFDTTMARAILVSEGEATLRRVQASNMRGGSSTGVPSNEYGGYVGMVQGGTSKLVIEDSEFKNIDAFAHNGGAFVARDGGELQILGTTVLDGNTAWKGGAALARYGGTIIVDAIGGGDAPQFMNNHAAAEGGAIAIIFDGSVGDIRQGTFSSNSTNDRGAHLAVDDATLTVTNALLEGGEADKGGAIAARLSQSGGSLSIGAGTMIDDNFAWSYGGGIYAEDSDVIVGGATIGNNQVEDSSGLFGGGLYATRGSLDVSSTTFTGNSALNGGGAVAMESVNPVSIRGSAFFTNSSYQGGGLMVDGDGGTELVQGNLFCGNSGMFADAAIFFGSGTRSALIWANNLVDGEAGSGSVGLAVYNRTYEIRQNTFVRLGDSAVEFAGGSGAFRRNLMAWNGGEQGLTAVALADIPETIEDNAWYDPNGDWLAGYVVAAGVDQGSGSGAVFGDPRLTTQVRTGSLQPACYVEDHFMRPDTSLALRPWDDSDIQEHVIGVLGGPEDVFGVWALNEDKDPVVAVWDCDETDNEVHERLLQYWDNDGDGYVGSPTDGFECDLLAGNGPDIDDCDDNNDQVFEGCDDTGLPDGPYWYGSGCSTAQPSGFWAMAWLPLLLLRRRKRA